MLFASISNHPRQTGVHRARDLQRSGRAALYRRLCSVHPSSPQETGAAHEVDLAHLGNARLDHLRWHVGEPLGERSDHGSNPGSLDGHHPRLQVRRVGLDAPGQALPRWSGSGDHPLADVRQPDTGNDDVALGDLPGLHTNLRVGVEGSQQGEQAGLVDLLGFMRVRPYRRPQVDVGGRRPAHHLHAHRVNHGHHPDLPPLQAAQRSMRAY